MSILWLPIFVLAGTFVGLLYEIHYNGKAPTLGLMLQLMVAAVVGLLIGGLLVVIQTHIDRRHRK